MDPLKLLSRSTKRPRITTEVPIQSLPSTGQHDNKRHPQPATTGPSVSRKRKRDPNTAHLVGSSEPANFFADHSVVSIEASGHGLAQSGVDGESGQRTEKGNLGDGSKQEVAQEGDLPHAECKRILQQHKLKVTRLNTSGRVQSVGRVSDGKKEPSKAKDVIYPQPLLSFEALGWQYGVGSRLARNIADQGYKVPTEVQLAALPLLMDDDRRYLPAPADDTRLANGDGRGIDLLSIAPTGSGKTLAFLVPLLRDIMRQRQREKRVERHTSAIVLAPTKELAAQIVNEGRKLAKDTGVKITQMRKGMTFWHEQLGKSELGHDSEVSDKPEEDSVSVVKSDMIVSTPGLLWSALQGNEGADHLSGVRHLVLDEADVLLDPLFKDQTLFIWHSLTHQSLRMSLWSATMGSNIEDLARSIITARLREIGQASDGHVSEGPVIRLVVGLKDSAAPNVEHKLIYAASEQGKLMGLRQLLHPTSSSVEAGPILRPPFLVFTQTIGRAAALHSELRYDVPAEAGGISRIAVLHADLSATTRDDVMTRFRQGSIWILITTDLLSRGVDFRGVNGVVNYDIPGSSAAYIHRIGRTGRAGREGGIAVTLYSKEDMPYLKHVANVVAMSQREKGQESSSVQQWLVDLLPTLSKNEKQSLKKHGVKSRSTKDTEKSSKAGRRTRISTKPGFVRQTENRRKGAILGSQRRTQDVSNSDSEPGNETEFAGFD